MVRGTLEVLLVSAKGLVDVDFFASSHRLDLELMTSASRIDNPIMTGVSVLVGKMDPYAVLMYRSQEQKSSTASGAGSNPEWNETFVFNVSDSVSELIVKLMDSDTFSKDDFVGEAKIPLEAVFAEGSLPPTVYSVVKDQRYCGEIKVGLTFTPVETRGFDEEAFGGWKHSAH